MIDETEVAERISRQLRSATESPDSLSESALIALAGLSAWPQCLLQLLPSIVGSASCCKVDQVDLKAALAADKNKVMQRLLTSVFGDLQAVWRDNDLQSILMQLPCPAMLLLLSSDDLRVPSEDIVLFSIQEYSDTRQIEDTAVTELYECLRAPCLSDVMLHYLTLRKDDPEPTENSYASKLRALLLLRRSVVGERDSKEYKEQLLELKPPHCWLLGHRQLVPATPATVDWKLPVEELKEACRLALAKNKSQELYSPWTPPMSGFVCFMMAFCEVAGGKVRIDIGVGPGSSQRGFFFKLQCAVIFNGDRRDKSIGCLPGGHATVWEDFFKVGAMPSGWDEAVWVAKGLPTSGDLMLTLEVLSVS